MRQLLNLSYAVLMEGEDAEGRARIDLALTDPEKSAKQREREKQTGVTALMGLVGRIGKDGEIR